MLYGAPIVQQRPESETCEHGYPLSVCQAWNGVSHRQLAQDVLVKPAVFHGEYVMNKVFDGVKHLAVEQWAV